MPDRTTSYKYDKIYQLLEAVSSTPGWSANSKTKGSTNPLQNQKEFYSYDPVGNRLFGPDKNDLYSYNTGNQLVSSSEAQFEYDLNGNLIFKTNETGTASYSYDYENRLTRVIMPDGTTSVYTYDPFGRRISKSVSQEGTTSSTYYLYDNEDILFEYDATGAVGNRYIHGPGIDEPLALMQDKGTYYYHADGLGSITAMTDSAGKVVQTYEYDSFGKLKDLKNRIKQPYTFTGREFDRETGLYYYRARYYDAEAGRFISKDPIGFRGEINHFTYVLNNPMNSTDLFGLAGTGDIFYDYRPCSREDWAYCMGKCSPQDVENCTAVYRCSPTIRSGDYTYSVKKLRVECKCKDNSCQGEDKRTFGEKLSDAWDNFNDFMQRIFPDPNSRPTPPYPAPLPMPIPVIP